MGVCAPFTHAINHIPEIATIGKSTDNRIVTQRWLAILLIQVFCTKACDVLHELPLTITKGQMLMYGQLPSYAIRHDLYHVRRYADLFR